LYYHYHHHHHHHYYEPRVCFRSEQEKEKELANLPRALGGSRVGPSAVRKLHALLTTDDPFKPVKSLTKE
jgi:hypothetical protein